MILIEIVMQCFG